MRKSKKILSSLLALIITLSFFPLEVLAAELEEREIILDDSNLGDESKEIADKFEDRIDSFLNDKDLDVEELYNIIDLLTEYRKLPEDIKEYISVEKIKELEIVSEELQIKGYENTVIYALKDSDISIEKMENILSGSGGLSEDNISLRLKNNINKLKYKIIISQKYNQIVEKNFLEDDYSLEFWKDIINFTEDAEKVLENTYIYDIVVIMERIDRLDIILDRYQEEYNKKAAKDIIARIDVFLNDKDLDPSELYNIINLLKEYEELSDNIKSYIPDEKIYKLNILLEKLSIDGFAITVIDVLKNPDISIKSMENTLESSKSLSEDEIDDELEKNLNKLELKIILSKKKLELESKNFKEDDFTMDFWGFIKNSEENTDKILENTYLYKNNEILEAIGSLENILQNYASELEKKTELDKKAAKEMIARIDVFLNDKDLDPSELYNIINLLKEYEELSDNIKSYIPDEKIYKLNILLEKLSIDGFAITVIDVLKNPDISIKSMENTLESSKSLSKNEIDNELEENLKKLELKIKLSKKKVELESKNFKENDFTMIFWNEILGCKEKTDKILKDTYSYKCNQISIAIKSIEDILEKYEEELDIKISKDLEKEIDRLIDNKNSSIEDIEDTLVEYEGLSDNQKSYISDEKITLLEKIKNDKIEAKKIEDKIIEILSRDKLGQADLEEINNSIEKYNKLSEDEKSYIDDKNIELIEKIQCNLKSINTKLEKLTKLRELKDLEEENLELGFKLIDKIKNDELDDKIIFNELKDLLLELNDLAEDIRIIEEKINSIIDKEYFNRDEYNLANRIVSRYEELTEAQKSYIDKDYINIIMDLIDNYEYRLEQEEINRPGPIIIPNIDNINKEPESPFDPEKDKDIEKDINKDQKEESQIEIQFIKGYPDNTIRTDNKITREEVAIIVYRLLNETEIESLEKSIYKDVDKQRWSYQAIKALSDKDILNGYTDKTFKPKKSMSRAEAIKIISNAKKIGNDVEVTIDDDVDYKGHWAENYIVNAINNNWILVDSNGNINPDGNITRGEFIVLVNKAFNIEKSIIDRKNLPKDLYKDNKYYDHILKSLISLNLL